MTAYAMIPGSVGLLAAMLWAVRAGGERLGLKAETRRKTVHIGLGLYCLTFPVLFDAAWQVAATCGLGSALLVALRGGPRAWTGLGSALHSVDRESYGEIFFAAAVALLFLLKRDQVLLYLLPIAIMTLADAAAALVGSRYGRRVFQVERSTKSFEGAGAFFVVAWILSIGMLEVFAPLPLAHAVALSTALALFGASIEAESWRGWDNLFVPLGLYVFLKTYLDGSVSDLVLAAAVYAAMLVASLWAVRRLGADSHTARIATIVIFCIWMSAGTINIVTPMVLLLAFILLEGRHRSTDLFPHLQSVLALMGIALFWYAVAELSGYNAIFLFHLSLGLVAAALVGIALWPRWLLAAGLVVGLWLLASLRLASSAQIDNADLPFAAAGLLLMLLAAFVASRARMVLARHRAHRLALAGTLTAAALLPIAPP